MNGPADNGAACVQRLRPQLHRLLLGRYQAYVWSDSEGATLIDTGESGSARLIAGALEGIGLARQDVRQVVLTHFHDDHTGSAAEVASWNDAEVIAHALDAPVIEGARPGPPPNFTDFERDLHTRVAAGLQPAPPVKITHTVRDGDVLDFGAGAHVLSAPGHTDGSIALYLPAHQVLITGDIAAEYDGSVILGVFNLDRTQAAKSFRRLAALDVEVAAFGHGEPLLNDASAHLREVANGLA